MERLVAMPMKISAAAEQLGMSADTLRYYEKLGLISIGRNPAGVRVFSEQDLSRLRFIQRAQQMNFKLAEIKDLLAMRQNPQGAKAAIRQATAGQLAKTNRRIEQLTTLRNELQLLLNLCQKSADGCPIMEELDA